MHEPAGVVENLVQILHFTPYSAIQNTPPPPGNENCQRSWHFDFSVAEYPPPEMKIVRDLGTLTFQLQNTPPPENLNLGISWHFDFSVAEYPPPKMKIVRDLGTLTFQLQNTPPLPRKFKFRHIWHFDFSVAEYPPPPENENC